MSYLCLLCLLFVTYSAVQYVLTVYMKKMTDILSEAGTAYPSRASEFTSGVWLGSCCSSF
jgi:hypothetical protein